MGIFVNKRENQLPMVYLPLILSLLLYFALHSLLADGRVKPYFAHLFPKGYYRLFYNLVAIAGLIPAAYFFVQLDRHYLIEPPIWMQLIGGITVGMGLLLLNKAMQGYDLGEFVGTTQLKTKREKITGTLNTTGLNAVVRHPLYLASLFLIWGVFLALPDVGVLVIAVISTGYLLIGIQLEEQKLVEDFGETYRVYQQKVPMLLPGVKDLFRWFS